MSNSALVASALDPRRPRHGKTADEPYIEDCRQGQENEIGHYPAVRRLPMEQMYRGLPAFPSTCLDTVRNISLKAFTVADFGIKNETEMPFTVYEDDETPEAQDLIAGCVGSPSRQGGWACARPKNATRRRGVRIVSVSEKANFQCRGTNENENDLPDSVSHFRSSFSESRPIRF